MSRRPKSDFDDPLSKCNDFGTRSAFSDISDASAEMVSSTAARTLPNTRAGGQDDGSYTNSLKLLFLFFCRFCLSPGRTSVQRFFFFCNTLTQNVICYCFLFFLCVDLCLGNNDSWRSW